MTMKYEVNRAGATLVFKKGVTEKQAIEALRKIPDVLDPKPEELVESFDDRFGGPVFYIP